MNCSRATLQSHEMLNAYNVNELLKNAHNHSKKVTLMKWLKLIMLTMS